MDVKEMEKKKLNVVVRIRPQQKQDNVWVKAIDDHRLQTVNHRNVDEALEYEFERVFNEETPQATVYESCVQPLLKHILEGQNASVFAYGPTGSGKTHTISGNELSPGIIPRCVRDIFSLIAEEKQKPIVGAGCRYSVKYSYLEIYNEKVHDLLDSSRMDLPIRQDRDQTLFVANLTEQEIESLEDFNQSFVQASKKRTTAATKLNVHSSRSHAVLLIKVLKTDMTSSVYRKLTGKIYVIDLAGSEDNRRTGNQGIRLKESGAINTSLFMLAEVVDALNKGKAVVPYRQSKLTRLLQDSLGGTCHSVMIINIAPEEQHYLDTVSTLKLARKAKKIVNTIVTNETIEPSLDDTKDAKQKEAASKTWIKARRVVSSSVSQVPSKKPTSGKDDKEEEPEKTIVTPPSDSISLFSPLRRTQNELVAQLRKMQMELDSIKDKMSMEARNTTKDELSIIQPLESHNTMSQLCDFTMDTTSSCQPLESTAICRPQRRALADLKLENLLDSPLCLPPASKRSKNSHEEEDSRDAPFKSCYIAKSSCFDPDLRRKQNLEVLSLLNGSLNDLRQLQKIGPKKARLIQSWRQINGPLHSVGDLQSIPGFTGYKNFLQANFLQVD